MNRLVVAIFVGLIVSYYSIGSRVVNSDEFTQLFERAEQRHVATQYELGSMYDLGEGISQDYLKAANLYRRAPSRNMKMGLSNTECQSNAMDDFNGCVPTLGIGS